METKCRLLLARLAKIAQHDSNVLNKHNLMLGDDPYGLARGFPDAENRDVREYLLGAPWTRLVNEGLLIDPSGQGFHKVSDEGRDYLSQRESLAPTQAPIHEAPKTDPENPRAFLSYSWDGAAHHQWVTAFAERLQGESGVWVIFDHWHLKPGDDKLHFMERGISEADFVVVICTPAYAERANRRSGGVGYESMVISAEMAEQLGTNKFIPVLRNGDWSSAMPTYLKSRWGINLSSEPYEEQEYEKLLRALHREPPQPPPIGRKPDFSRTTDRSTEHHSTSVVGTKELSISSRIGTDEDAHLTLLADIISELQDNYDRACRPRTGDTYRQPSDRAWLDNRNKVHIPGDLRSQVAAAYHEISSWSDIVRSGINPNLGSQHLNFLASGLRSSLPQLISQLRKLHTPNSESKKTDPDGDSLIVNTPDDMSLRFSTFDSTQIRGVQLEIENYRLTSIRQIRVIIASASSFDRRYADYREPILTGQVFERPNVIRPSFRGNPIVLIQKAPEWPSLITRESNLVRQLLWPDTDKSETERWKLSLRVIALNQPADATGQSIPLKEFCTDIVVLWTRAQNEFSFEEIQPEVSAALSEAFPLDGKDGTKRTVARYIICGKDQLFAYRTIRDGLKGERFLVVRQRPDQEPQSFESPDRDAANVKWNEWYQEWKKKGFGGASGTGLGGEPPF